LVGWFNWVDEDPYACLFNIKTFPEAFWYPLCLVIGLFFRDSGLILGI
jgi:hypothetical protein